MAVNKVRELGGTGKARVRVLSKLERYKESGRAQKVPSGTRTVLGSVVTEVRGT